MDSDVTTKTLLKQQPPSLSNTTSITMMSTIVSVDKNSININTNDEETKDNNTTTNTTTTTTNSLEKSNIINNVHYKDQMNDRDSEVKAVGYVAQRSSTSQDDLNYKSQVNDSSDSPMTSVGYIKDQQPNNINNNINNNNNNNNNNNSVTTSNSITSSWDNDNDNDLNYKAQVTDGPMTNVGYQKDNGVVTTTTSSSASHQNNNDKAQYQSSANRNNEPDSDLARLEERIAAKVASSGIPSRTRGASNDEISKIEEEVASKIAADRAMDHSRADSRPNALTEQQVHEETIKAPLQVHEENIKALKESQMKTNTSSYGIDNEHPNTGMSLSPTKYITTHGSYSDRVRATPLQESALDIDTLQGNGYIDSGYCLDDEDNLAVAMPVEEDEDDDKFLPAAIEFDPDQKNVAVTKSRKKTSICLGIVALVVIVSVVVGVVVGTSTNSDGSTTPAVNPREQVGISNFVASQVGTSALENPESPYKKALNWMTFHDPRQLTIDAPNFMQRFILAYTYYATSTTRPWDYCSPPVDNITEPGPCRYGSVSRLRENFRDWTLSKKYWLSGEDECEWAGIDCDKTGNVLAIQIAGRNMTGSLSNIERLLPFVKIYDVARNGLEGSIPTASFQNSKHLLKLALLQNSLTGPIPSGIWSLRNLKILAVHGNMLTGSLPEQLSIMKDAKSLELSRNRFSGTIPSTISNLKSLHDIYFDNNLFSGILPSELLMSPTLVTLFLQSNKFSENLPIKIELPELIFFDVGSNMLTGQIPDGIYNCTDLRYLNLNGNFINGTISTLIGKLEYLIEATFDTNQFTGTIPLEIGNVTTLEIATFSGTNLTDSVPDTLCRGKKWDTLSANCAADDDGEPQISCSCCTSCCSASGQSCS